MHRLGIRVPAASVQILRSPDEFFQTLCGGIKDCRERYAISSLYLGTGKKCEHLVSILEDKETQKIPGSMLFDARRSLRRSPDGNHSFRDFTKEMLKNVYLFKSPSTMAEYFPARANEIFGTQHTKLYVFDNSVIISGANLSSDYFTNRQDRYWLFHSAELANYCCDLMASIQKISYQVDVSSTILGLQRPSHFPEEGELNEFSAKTLTSFMEASMTSHFTSKENYNEKEEAFITPSIQMGKYGVQQDAESLLETLSAFNHPGASLDLATAYFNVDPVLKEKIIESEASWNLLTASPQANGFLGSRGFSSAIPFFYLHEEYRFLQECAPHDHIKMFEWKKGERRGREEGRGEGEEGGIRKEGEEARKDPVGTFHAKGLWASSASHKNPTLSICGSSNYGRRSLHLDLECQMTLETKNESLSHALGKERDDLFEESREIRAENFSERSEFHKNRNNWYIRPLSVLARHFL